MKEAVRREPTLEEEIASLSDDDVFEFTNLTSKHTGIDGVLFLSTAMGSHGPRVKYFVKTGKGQPSFPDKGGTSEADYPMDPARYQPSLSYGFAPYCDTYAT